MKDYHHHGGSAYITDEGIDLELRVKNDTSGGEEVAQEEGPTVQLASVKEGEKQTKEKRKTGLRKRYSVRSSIGGAYQSGAM